MKTRPAALAPLILALALVSLSPLAAQARSPVVSEKQDVAIFALGYYGWNIPLEALGNIDLEIQKVFVDLGRFNIIGVTQRLSSGGLEQFIASLKKAKQENVVIPDKYQFGEAILTEADFAKLVGAFVVAAPVVSGFNSYWDQKRLEWVTELKTNVSFIDVAAGGTLMAISEVSTSGSDKSSQVSSITQAIDAIPMQLQFEIRSVPAFQINTRILTVSGSEIKLQLGQNMGIQKGDEYAIIVGGMVEGFREDREAGLVVIKDVGAEVSTGQVLFGGKSAAKDAQLREIPRLGVDAEPYIHIVGGQFLPGARAVVSRGFYGFRPYVGVQFPVQQIGNFLTVTFVPVTAVFGGEYNLTLGRLSLTPYGGAGFTYVYLFEALSGTETETNIFPHVGVQGYVRASYLINRNMRIYAEAGLDGWLSINSFFDSYGGLGFGGGVSFKL